MNEYDKYADVVFVSSETHFSWADRVRILCGWSVHTLTPVGCEHVPGWTETLRTRLSFIPPALVLRLRRTRHAGGYSVAATTPAAGRQEEGASS